MSKTKVKNILLIILCCVLAVISVVLIFRASPLYWEKKAGSVRLLITLSDGTKVPEMTAYSYTPRDIFLMSRQKQVDKALESDLDNVALSFSKENGYVVPEYELISTTSTSAKYRIFAEGTDTSWEVWVLFENGGAEYAVYKGGTDK